MKKTAYNKATLIRELAFSAGITQKKARFVLDALTHIAYREAADDGFTIPGICRLDVIQRKSRRMKNPQTGETILIAEHRALRVRALKAARNAVTPPPDNLVTVLPQEAPAPVELEDFSNAISFRCKKCGQEIEAPHAAIGVEAQCPACGASITVPAESEAGTLHRPVVPPPPVSADFPAIPPAAAPAAVESGAPSAASGAAPAPSFADQKARGGQTIRIDLAALGFAAPEEAAGPQTLPPKRMLSFFCKNCRQEIEAPADMAGTSSECPSCGVSFEVPFFSDPGTLHGSDLDNKSAGDPDVKDARARTIRIEVPDDF